MSNVEMETPPRLTQVTAKSSQSAAKDDHDQMSPLTEGLAFFAYLQRFLGESGEIVG